MKRLTIRNKQWDLMRAIGILAIIWGHNFQPPYLFFPAFYFAIPLFFFVSGYFFKPQITVGDKFSYLIKKTRKQLIPYLLLNLFFGLITMWLKTKGIALGDEVSFHSLFITPFSGGDQFYLFLAAWFLFNIYYVSIFAGLLYQKNRLFNYGIVVFSIILMGVMLSLGKNQHNSMWMIFLIRSAFGFCFFSLGYLFRMHEESIKRVLLKVETLIFLYLVITFLDTNFGELSFDILFGNVTNDIVIVPVISSLCIILLLYALTYYLNTVLKPSFIAYAIGEHSFTIMIWHLTFFFLVNVLLYFLGIIPFTALSDVYYRYDIERFWLLYQIPAIFGSLGIVWLLAFVQKQTLSMLPHKKQPTPALTPVAG